MELGQVHADAVPEMVARVGYYNGTDGVYMQTKPYAFAPNLWDGDGKSWQTSSSVNSKCSAVVDKITGSTKIRAWGSLACVYLGQPAS